MFEGVEAVILNTAAHNAASAYKTARKRILAGDESMLFPAHGDAQEKTLRVHVIAARNLPKLKSTGMDGMCHVMLNSHDAYTPVCPQSRNPEWGHTIKLPLPYLCISQLMVEVLDHEQEGESGFLGRAYVCANDIMTLSDEPREVELELWRYGEAVSSSIQPVKTARKEKSVVLLGISAVVEIIHKKEDIIEAEREVEQAVESVVVHEAVVDRGKYRVSVVSGAHMPKMDSFLGTCDPYCIARYGDKDMRTGTGKGYDVRWDATFDVDADERPPQVWSKLVYNFCVLVCV
jgi:hypothetical protein